MSAAPPTAGPNVTSDNPNPTFVYVLVIVVEALVISVLYWLSRHFS